MIKFKLKRKSSFVQDTFDEILNECEHYRKYLIRFCSEYFEYENECSEDCVQEAYLALCENLFKGIEITNYKSWLIKVVLNQKNKIVKDKITRNEKDFNDSDKKDFIMNSALVYNPDYVEQLISDEIIEARMMTILSKLNKDEQYLYFSHYHNKKNLKEISEIMGISHTAVRQRHVELKKKIIKFVKEYEEN